MDGCKIFVPFTVNLKCDYIPPTPVVISVKKMRDGKIKVKFADEKGWIDAEYDKEKGTLKFYR